MTDEDLQAIENSRVLTDVYGQWPSFHDAEVHRVILNRSGDEGPTLESVIHAWETTPEVDERGSYVQTKHMLVTLLFKNITDLVIDDFNSQNVLFSVYLARVVDTSPESRKWQVNLSGIYGMDAKFLCSSIVIKGVHPYSNPEFPS